MEETRNLNKGKGIPKYKPKKNAQTFTHFINLPLIQNEIQKKIQELQDHLYSTMTDEQKKIVTPNNPNLFHLTFAMYQLFIQLQLYKMYNKRLNLPREEQRQQAIESLQYLKPQIEQNHKTGITLHLKGVNCFRIPNKTHPGNDKFDEVSVIYLDLENSGLNRILEESCHLMIKNFIAREIIHEDDLKSMNIKYKQSKYTPEKMHVTLFRVHEQWYKDDSGAFQRWNWRNVFEKYSGKDIGEVKISHIDISTRFVFDKDDLFYLPLARVQIESLSKAPNIEDNKEKP